MHENNIQLNITLHDIENELWAMYKIIREFIVLGGENHFLEMRVVSTLMMGMEKLMILVVRLMEKENFVIFLTGCPGNPISPIPPGLPGRPLRPLGPKSPLSP